MRWSIRYQLLVPLLTLLAGVVGMTVWAALASAAQARGQLEARVERIAETVRRGGFPLKENVLRLMKGFSGADYLLVHGDRRAGTFAEPPRRLPAGPVAEGGGLRLEDRVEVAGAPYLCAAVRLHQGEDAGGILYIFYPESLWRGALWEAVRPPLVLGAVGGVAALAITVVLAQRLTARVQDLEQRTRLIAEGDFSPMPLPARLDELHDLARSVNEMAQKLARYQESVEKTERLRLLGQLSGGLAHQLRNGVTGARLAVQLHARECGAGGESLAVALRQLSLVELHLRGFLDMGRAGAARREPCSLTALLGETVALLLPQCRHTRIDLHWQPPDDPWAVSADPGQLQHVLVNVLTNAMEAAGPGGSVRVGLGPSAGGAAGVTVCDSGPGPPPGVTDRLFEPFVTGKPEGVGLGLAVARRVVELHGGRISWRREAGRTCFLIELPRGPGA